ncbi:MAG: FHA domain-containing protein [Gammaproteobacteria bacterium]|nr:MAG: FHA domain-containing protein [Gammaproteobacteria bacterium]
MAQQENQWQQALAAIDASSIDALNAIKKDHDILDERLKALDGVKQEFADAVYNRVRGDYEKRRAALDEQAAPLKDAARAQYAKLRELTQRIETDHEAIKLDQQELELRRKLGEFDEKEFKRRLGEIEGTIKERTQAHEQASALKKRFLEPFSDESELTAMQDEAAAAAAQISVPGTTQRQTLAGADLAAIANTLAEMRTNEVAAVLSDAPPNKTQVMSAINLPEPALAAAGAPAGGATQVFRAARLVPQNPEAGKQSYALALKPTNIGADAANEIRIVGPGVDAKHAQIAVSMGGFTIVDLNSKHGTRVNAEKVRERQLRHEDVVQIGAARFVFREG